MELNPPYPLYKGGVDPYSKCIEISYGVIEFSK
ncbi:hypothetical protein SAMN04489723_107240 [Algoriphagus aquimarinus]|uniref:Uncharacterized protein n=1 Tax=Algoriphagus aquimarinus TaxID=237018 RepID=A0A1I1A7T1_9BACT|nr:hypothetical protein SAMN04489723_107240 [Algoriphagus aquimarinus]